MAIVYCDLVNGIDWYTKNVYAAGTTYALNDLVIQSAASGLTSVTARVWKSLQNSNTGNALEEGAWWTLVADGSAAKPFCTIDDATRAVDTSVDSCRAAKCGTLTPLTGTWTINDYNVAVNGGKLVSEDTVDHTAEFTVGLYYGNPTIGWFKYASGTWSAGNPTVVTITGGAWTSTGAAVTGQTLYLITPASVATQSIKTAGVSEDIRLDVSCGWNISDPDNPVRDGYSYIYAADTIRTMNYIKLSYVWMVGKTLLHNIANYCLFDYCKVSYGYLTNANYGINNTYTNCFANNGVSVAPSYIGAITEYDDCVFIGLSNVLFNNAAAAGKIIANRCIFSITSYINGIHNEAPNIGIFATHEDCTYIGVGTLNRYQYGDIARITPAIIISKNPTFISAKTANYRPTRSITAYSTYNGVVSDNRVYTPVGSIYSDETTRHTASGLSWRYEPADNADSTHVLELLVPYTKSHPFEVAVAANQQVTATIWCKKSSTDSAFEARLICKGGQLAGITNDVTAVASDSTDWQQLTIQVTPTETGVLRFGFQVWGSATATCHIDDFGVSQ